MHILKLIGAFLAGVIAGSLVNSGIVLLGPHVIPVPPGADMSDPESIRASLHLLEARHFVFPFLAHALGTLTGAFVGYLLAPRAKDRIAWLVGVFFLSGGIAASLMIPAPKAFLAIDLVLAYLPMAWLAIKLGRAVDNRRRPSPGA